MASGSRAAEQPGEPADAEIYSWVLIESRVIYWRKLDNEVR
jgi:hypothetical protein